MSTPVADNPAVTDPRAALTPRQREALGALAFYRHRYRNRAGWQIGSKVFSPGTIKALESKSLVRTSLGSLSLTLAGQLAADRLKEGPR